MKFWNWLTGKPKSAVNAHDFIWKTANAKTGALATEIRTQTREQRCVLLVAHFAGTLSQLKVRLDSDGVPYLVREGRLTTGEFLHQVSGDGGPLLVLADRLVPDEFPDPVNEGQNSVSILVAERHFVSAKDDRIVAFAASLGIPCRLEFHVSLQDLPVKILAGDWIEGMLTSLGMEESQPIQSALVARRLRQALARLTRRLQGDRPADSPEEWLRLNLPGEDSRQ